MLILKTKSKLIKKIFAYYSDQDTDLLLKDKLYLDAKVNDFFNNNYSGASKKKRKKLVKKLEKFQSYDLNNYECSQTKLDRETYLAISLFATFKSHLYSRIYFMDHKKPTIISSHLVRKVSPPLSAYVYTGNSPDPYSSAKIKALDEQEKRQKNGRSYGLLFE